MKKKIMHLFLCITFVFCTNVPIHADDGLTMWRLYNPNSGEHFYTSSEAERDNVYNAGWNIEGYGWISPSNSDIPVYRLYNPNAGDHHYTASLAEKDSLVSVGWKYETIAWYATDANSGIPIYREYNPNAKAGSHNFTTNKTEHDMLVSVGWKDEGIAFYVLEGGSTEGSRTHNTTSDTPSSSNWDGVYVYSTRSSKFHKSICPTATNISAKNKRTETNRDVLIQMGKSPCNVCKP